MEYRTPKVLEKKPIIAGFDLKIIVVISGCFLLFLFTVFSSFLLSLVFIFFAMAYIKVQKKYPNKGQLKMVLKYNTNIQCIRINEPIKNLLKKKHTTFKY
jgi:type IV secretory pathway VirB3-like protein